MPDLVTVVVPVRNRPTQLRKCVDSILAQTHQALEIIIVDDASTDDTPDVIRELTGVTKGGRRVRGHFLETTGGACCARNAGARLAQGAWIAFLDSDDAWSPELLETQLTRVKSLGDAYGICCCGREIRDAQGDIFARLPPPPEGDLSDLLLRENVVGATSVALVRMDVLQAAGGFDPALPACQDWDFWIRVSRHTLYATVDGPVLIYDASPAGRITTSARRRLNGHMGIWRKHMRHSPPAAGHRATFLATLGDIFMELRRPGWARRMFAAAFVDSPSVRLAVQLALAQIGSRGIYSRVRRWGGKRHS